MSKLTENTTVTFSILGALLVVVVTVVFWAADVKATANQALAKADRVRDMALDIARIQKDIEFIKEKLK